MKKMLVVMAVIALLAGATYGYAHGPWFGPGYGPGSRPGYGPMHGPGYGPMHGPGFGPGPSRGHCWEGEGYGSGASLTPEQRTKFQELRRKFDDETAQLRTSIFAKRQELRSLWNDPKADSNAILQKEKEVRELQNQMHEKAIEFKLEARKILPPEQLSGYGRRGMGPGYGPGYGPRHGRGYGRGPGYGMGPGYGFRY